MNNSFLGKGWSFPPTFDNKTRGVVMTEGEEDINRSLEILLGTRIGERTMRPSFGTNLDTLQFEAIDLTLVSSLNKDLEYAITVFEPRINLKDIGIVQDESLVGRIFIVIDYEIRETNTRTNLVYPFYLNEASEAR